MYAAGVRAHWKPILALLLLTPFLTELLSGSLPAQAFFRPQVILFLSTVGYGFPVLLLREFAVRRQLGVAGLFILGIVYGIFNEGIIAKTFYLATRIPIQNFDDYGYVGGISVPWAVMISLWHALHSVVYPIVAIGYFFPRHRDSPWLNRWEIASLAMPTTVMGALIFFNRGQERAAGQPVHFILMLIAGALLVGLAAKLPIASRLGAERKLRVPAIFLGGLTFLAFVLGPILLAAAKIPVVVFCGYEALLVSLIFRQLGQCVELPVNTVLLFAIGDDLLLALFGVVGALGKGDIQNLLTEACFVILFGFLIARLRRLAPKN